MSAGFGPEDFVNESPDTPNVSRGDPEFSEGLVVGLMGVCEGLKEALGISGQDNEQFAAIEQFVREIEAENAQLRQHALDAIEVAENIREENSSLLEELTQVKLHDMVHQAAELDKVTHEYDVEVMQAHIAEAEAVLEEVAELRSRVGELEEENTGLTEMLNEMRQSQQQLKQLQMLEEAGENNIDSVERGLVTPGGPALSAAGGGMREFTAESSPSFKDATSGLASPLMTESTPGAGNASPEKSPRMQTPGSTAKDPLAVAEALSAVAGGSSGGVAAAAARMLRDYSVLQANLEEEQAKNTKLATEVKELTEITSSKTFKAPSAWAEREVKYRQEKERWEESMKENEVKFAAMKEELEGLRNSSGTLALEKRIEELEARLLESERDRDNAKSALHEMEINSRASVGEFSLTGVKPYRGPRVGEEGEVQQAISAIESSGGSPPRSISFQNHDETTPISRGPVDEDQDRLVQQFAALQMENSKLRAELEKAGVVMPITVAAMETPQIVRDALSESAVKKAKDLENQLATTKQGRAELLAELEELKAAAAARGAEEAQRVTIQLKIAETETRAEVALLQHGVDADSARQLAVLAAQLQDAERREKEALAKLEAANTAVLQVNVQEGEQKVVVEEQRVNLEIKIQETKEEREKIQEQIREVATAAVVAPELLSDPVGAEEGIAAEALPEEMVEYLQEAAEKSPAGVVVDADTEDEQNEEPSGARLTPRELSPVAVQRIESLQAQLKAAEKAIAALEKGVAPVQMHISVKEAQQQQQQQQVVHAPEQLVQMRISVAETPAETTVKLPITLMTGEEAVASIHMPINVIEQYNNESTVVKMPISVSEQQQQQEGVVRMPITVNETTTTVVGGEGVRMPITVVEGQQQQQQQQGYEPVKFAINVNEETRVQLPISVTEEQRQQQITNNETIKMAINVAEGSQPSSTTIHMPINVTETAGGAAGEALVRMAINITEHQQQQDGSVAHISMPLNIVAPDEPVTRVVLPISVAESEQAVRIPITIATDPKKEQRMKQLEEMLKTATEEEERLRKDLEALAPIKLNFSFNGADTGVSRRSSVASMDYSPEALAKDRAAAEAAYQDHLKSTDGPSLMRAKAELETKCQMLQAQLDKMQGALADADREKVEIQESIEDAMAKGDVGLLAGIKESFKGSTARVMAGGRNLKVFGKRKAGVSSKEIKTALHDTQDALVETEAERNALRRQLARMSKKMDKKKGGGTATPPTAEGIPEEAGLDGEEDYVDHGHHQEHELELEDAEMELVSLRDENQMLMEHLVSTKIKLAEVEGDVLESRRALLRSREKQIQLARQIMDLQAAEEPLHQSNKLEMTPPTSARMNERSPERRRSGLSKMKLPAIPGL